MQDSQFYNDLLQKMEEKNYRYAIKDITISGFRKGKIPRSIIARTISQVNEKDRKKLLTTIFNIYFPNEDIESIDLHDLICNPENQSGVMAAYAFQDKLEDYNSQYTNIDTTDQKPSEEDNKNNVALGFEKITTTPNKETKIETPKEQNSLYSQTQDDDEEHPILSERNKKTMTYIGCISIIDNPIFGLFYNFIPAATMDKKGEIYPLPWFERIKIFPTKGNINIRSRMRDDGKLSETFQDGAFYVMEIEESMLEENFKATGELNPTNYKVDISTLFSRNAIHGAEDVNFFPVIDYPEFDSKLAHDEIIQIPIHSNHNFSNERILLRDGNRLVGPFLVTASTDGSLYVAPQSKKKNYIFDEYFVKNSDNVIYSSQDVAGDIDITPIFYVNLNKITPQQKDFISADELLLELNNIVKTNNHDNLNEKHIAQAAFIDLKLPPEIIETRRQKVIELFKRQKSLGDMEKAVYESINEILVSAAQNDAEQFERTFSELSKREGFMSSIQRYRIISDEIEKKKNELQSLTEEKTNLENRISETKQEIENERLNVINHEIEQKKTELDLVSKQFEEKKASLDLVQDIEDLRVEKKVLERELERELADKKRELKTITEQTEAIIQGFDNHVKDAVSTIAQINIQDQVAGKIAEATRRNNKKEKDSLSSIINRTFSIYDKIYSKQNLGEDSIIDILISRVKQYRNYNYNDIINIFICISQGFLTVFSGAPGTGKTSICSIISHALGIDSINKIVASNDNPWKDAPERLNRFTFVPVERGWSSKRDFIGYYNPLTKEFDKSNKAVFEALESTSLEVEATSQEDKKEILKKLPPYIILLDEANLSPMEYYWADFMAACDQQDELSTVDIGEEKSLRISSSLRFLATINNDHTTESLSPRLVDRAWVITLPQPLAASRIKYLEQFAPISMEKLLSIFGENNTTNELNPTIQDILKKIYGLCKDKLGLVISPRVELAIKQYCYTGSRLFDNSDNEIDPAVIAVDYAIAQKILPKIQGNGTEYKKRLDEFLQITIQENLFKSADILKRLIQNGDNNMQYYQFFI